MEDHLGRQLLLVVLLIMVNAFFAASEIAVISLSGSKLRHEAAEGDKKAKRTERLLKNPTKFLSTIQIAITLAGFLASAFAADTFSDHLAAWLRSHNLFTSFSGEAVDLLCVIGITLVLSYFTLVFGELVPKRLAMTYQEKVTAFTGGAVLLLAKLFTPLVWLLSFSTNGILRLFNVDPSADGQDVSEEDIRMMVDIGEETGAIEAAEAELIDNIFEFNNITAGDVMTHRKEMDVVWLEDPAQDILELIRQCGHSRLPVCGEDIDDVIGLLRTRDYLLNSLAPSPLPLKELVVPAYLVPETVPADVLLRSMQKRKQHMAIVVDEYGGTSGLITMEDLLEEIVGDIYDEFDEVEEQEISRIDDNTWLVDGSCLIEDLSRELDISLPHEVVENFDTLGGMIFSCLDEIPSDGSRPHVQAFGLDIQVEEISDRRVVRAIVRKEN